MGIPENRSSKYLLIFLSCTWVIAFCSSRCIAAFFSDIEGAFDRVCTDFLIFKLWALGVSNQFLMFLQSLLSPRHGFVCVQGAKSSSIPLENTIFQGTVLGPPLWNVFFSDIAVASNNNEQVFADDLNLFQSFPKNADSDVMWTALREIQTKIHDWGNSNRVKFEPTKEEMRILHPERGEGNEFRLLGCIYDTRLTMEAAIDSITKKVRPKFKSLLRTRIFYSEGDIILQYKFHMLTILETHTGAIYHATTSALKNLDKLQIHFLEQLGLNEKQAFLQHNLLPLELRRDIAILGFLHKSNLGLNHPGVNEFFKAGGMPTIIHPAGSSYARRHDKPLFSHLDNVNSLNVLYRRSIPNMVHKVSSIDPMSVHSKTN
jgi:hypothetical protein